MTGRPVGGRTVDVLLTLLLTILVAAGLLLAAGHLAALLSGATTPTGGLADAVTIPRTPAAPGERIGSPDLHPAVYWTTLTGLLGLIAGSGWAGWWLWAGRPDRTRRPVGTATPREVARTASTTTLLARAEQLRPSLDRPRPAEVGYPLGRCGRTPVWASVEDSMLIIGPPRSGKGLHVVVPAVLDAPGAVVTTSTRPDTLTITLNARRRHGPVAVFDPQGLAAGIPAGLRWSPVRGCEDPHVAMVRATGLAAATGLSGGAVDNGGFWEAKTRTTVQTLLHAAALDGRDARHLYRWALNPASATDAARILHTHPDAADGWADTLEAIITADPRTRDSIWHGVTLAFAALADPQVMHALTPDPGEQFDPATFLTDRGTLYLLATGAGAGASAALVAAFIEDLTETARRLAARSPAGRLDPPLLLALDEIGNLAPLPSLPTLMADGGGTGITTMPVLQSVAQARNRWGEHAATAITDAATLKVILGGTTATRDLTDLSTLLGDRDDTTTTTSTDPTGQRSHTQTLRRIPIFPPEQIRTLPFGTALLLHRTTRPILTRLHPWTSRSDAEQLTADRDELTAALQRAATDDDGR